MLRWRELQQAYRTAAQDQMWHIFSTASSRPSLPQGLTADLLNFYNTNFESTVPEKAKLQKEKPLVAATTMVAVILQVMRVRDGI